MPKAPQQRQQGPGDGTGQVLAAAHTFTPLIFPQVVGRRVAKVLGHVRDVGADEEDGAVHPERGAGRAEGLAASRLPAPLQARIHRSLPAGCALSLAVGRGELVRGETRSWGGHGSLQRWPEHGRGATRMSSACSRQELSW